MNINFKNFSLQELENILGPDVDFFNDPGEKKPTIKKDYRLSAYLNFEVNKGSENLYFDFEVYAEDYERNAKTELQEAHTIKIYTKEAHNHLKDIIKILKLIATVKSHCVAFKVN